MFAYKAFVVMRNGVARALVILASIALAGCETTSSNLSDLLKPSDSVSQAPASADAASTSISADASGMQAQASAESAVEPASAVGVSADPRQAMLGSDPNDDLSLGKKQYRAKNFGMAEKYFRHAVELHPRDAESWIGLAASYDRLRRFDLADRAYGQAIKILGPTVEILNNEGYSFMLRGDYRRAREKLMAAQRTDPANKYVLNNLVLLDDSARTGKAIE